MKKIHLNQTLSTVAMFVDDTTVQMKRFINALTNAEDVRRYEGW